MGYSHGATANGDGAGKLGQVVVHKHHVSRLYGGVRAHFAHGNADVGAGEDRSVVDAVTYEDKGSAAALGDKQLFHRLYLVGGQKLCPIFFYGKVGGDCGGDLLGVARQHDGAADAQRFKVTECLVGVRLYDVGNDDVS